MKRPFLLVWLCVAVVVVADDRPYDFRDSDAYRALENSDRDRLEQVQRDFVLLWGALDMFADRNGGRLPETLDEVVPRYLKELPSDPFATEATLNLGERRGYAISKGGWGYGYRRGAEGNRAWVLASVGLPEFPFLAERGNIGLYVCKGTWISGINPRLMKRD